MGLSRTDELDWFKKHIKKYGKGDRLMTSHKQIDYSYKEHLIERQAKAEKAMLKEFHQGHYPLEKPLIKYNPYELNALSAVILFETEQPVAMTVRIKGKTEQADFYQSFSPTTQHILPIVGLYSDYDKQAEIYPWQNYDQKVVHTITTPETRS